MKVIRSKTGVRQLHRSAQANSSPIEISFLLQDWDDAYNVGGMFRVADAVGASEMFLTGKTPAPPNPMVPVTSLGHHRRVRFRQFAVHAEAAQLAKSEGYALVAVEIAESAAPYYEFDWPSKVCLVMGNEERGIYAGVLKLCDASVYIPMFGKGRSMNVHVSAAIVAFHARCVARCVPGVESE